MSYNNPFEREQIKNDLRRKSVQSALIRLIGNGSSAVLTLVSTIVLARLLTPEEFGLFAMVVAVTEFARSFVEIGLGTVTIQREEITHEEVSGLFWINVAVGLALTTLMAGLSPVVAWFYNDPRLFNVCLALSSVFLFSGLTVQHRSLLERQMQYGYLAAIYFTANLIGVLFALGLAMYGFGVWALVWREVVYAALYAAGIWLLCGWMPDFPRLNVSVRYSLSFGADLAGSGIVQYFTRNLDRVLIGRFCGAASLGFYSKAFQLVMMPVEHIRMTITAVGLSPLSALQSDDERYRRFYCRLLSVLSFLYMPIVVFLVIQSEEVILLLLGKQWTDAAPFLRIVAVAAFVGPILSTCQLVMITCGKSRRYFLLGLASAICMIMAYTIGIYWGAIGVANAYAITSYLLLIPSLWYGFTDTPISIILVIKTVALPVISSCCAGIILVVLSPAISNTSLLASIIMSVLIIALVYLGIWSCIPSGRRKLLEFYSYRMDLFGKK